MVANGTGRGNGMSNDRRDLQEEAHILHLLEGEVWLAAEIANGTDAWQKHVRRVEELVKQNTGGGEQ